MSLSPRAEWKINHVHPMLSSTQRPCFKIKDADANVALPFLGQLESIRSSTFSSSFSPIIHPSRSISPPALPSHFYRWNYCQGTVIIEFPDLRTPAPPFILYTAPHHPVPPCPPAIVLLLRAVLMYCPTHSFRVPEVCRILISLWEKYILKKWARQMQKQGKRQGQDMVV